MAEAGGDEVDDMSKKLMSLTSEVTRLKHEPTKAQALASHGRLSEQKCKLLEKKVEQDRQARIAYLTKVSVRRMQNADLAYGFTKWQANYKERSHSHKLLQKTMMRLMRPQLAASLDYWRAEWRAEETAQAQIEAEYDMRREEEKERQREEEMDALRTQLDDALTELESLRELEQRTNAKLAEQLNDHRDSSVGQLARSIVRRMMRQGLARGFQPWINRLEEKFWHKQLMIQAMARLTGRSLRSRSSLEGKLFGGGRDEAKAANDRAIAAEVSKRERAEAELDQ